MSFGEVAILSLTFLASLSLVWSSLRTGISPVPSSKKARQAILNAADLAPAGPVIELGSGWGHLALALAKKYPARQVVGYEVSPLPWLVSLLLKKLQGVENLTLKRKNFLHMQFPPAALLVCYLYPGGMHKLAGKLQRDKPQVAMLISNTFALPGHQPERVSRLADLYTSPVYIYRFRQSPPELADD